ncbi:MAG: hypothetical protein BroJett011_59710 [Chloroflexota bacterium]|nr:MAG: hypothetical protein BroJett011_59710 [Chloroflexota bacterium]
MSCGSKAKQVAVAAMRAAGITGNVSKKTFYMGAAATSLLLSGALLAHQLWRQRQILASLSTNIESAESKMTQANSVQLKENGQSTKIKTLTGQERVAPVPAEKLTGRRCGGCQAAAESKPGPWYVIQGQFYCQDCAQGKASQANVLLVSAEASRAASPNYPYQKAVGWSPRRINLKPQWIRVGSIKNVDGYVVTHLNGKASGLAIAPEIKMDDTSQLKINKARWFVYYDRISQPVAGPYESINQAKGIASLLVNLDWTRPIEAFTEDEIQAAKQAGNAYRADLEEEKIIKERAALFSA